MPVERRPATKVVVRQWPCGAASIRRVPFGSSHGAGPCWCRRRSRRGTRTRPGPCDAATPASAGDARRRPAGPARLPSAPFLVREAEPAQRRPDRRQRAGLKAALDRRIPDLSQGDALAAGRQLAQQLLVPGEQRLAVPPILAGSVLPVSRTRRTSLIAAEAPTSKRAAAAPAELPASTARASRLRKPCAKGAVVTAPRLNRHPRIRTTEPVQP